METMPDAAELLDAAIESLRADVLPALGGRPAFQLRVVLNVLDIARRELRHADAADAAELERLRALPGLAAAGESLPALRSALCEALRDGRFDLGTPGLAGHLWADVLARVAIEQPTYPSYLREVAAATGASPATPTAERP